MDSMGDDDEDFVAGVDNLEGSVLAGKKMSRFHSGLTEAQLKLERKLGEKLFEAVVEK